MTAKDMLKITVNLVAIYVIGGVILALIYSVASPIMYREAEKEKQAALKAMMPGDSDIEIKELGKWEPHHKHAGYYVARKCAEVKVKKTTDEKTGELKEEKECISPQDIGYIVESFGKGYSSYINMLVSVDKDFIVKKISILHHAETPGLGDEIEKDYFLKRFENKSIDNLVVIKGDTADKVEAISGATISSRAVTEDGARNGVKMLKEKLSGEGKEQHGPHS